MNDSVRSIGVVCGVLAVVLTVTASGCGDTDAVDQDTATDTGTKVDDIARVSSTLIVDPERVAFGLGTVGRPKILDLEVENAGDDYLTISSIAFDKAEGHFGANRVSLALTPREKIIIKITFYAVAEGVFEDTLVLVANGRNGTVSVVVSATASEALCQDLDGDLRGEGCAAGSDCNDNDINVYEGAPERCNYVDDDCDGLFDEDFIGLGGECEVGLGTCVTTGVSRCSEDGSEAVCDAVPGEGDRELCNGIDDDCDGLTDEEFPSLGKLCSSGVGRCRVVDKYVCSDDLKGLACPAAGLSPGAEICGDFVDNDCDGVTDEGAIEVCGDFIDNDCDGATDEAGSRWGESFFARDWYGRSVAVYPSNGDGTFEAPSVLDFPIDAYMGVVAVGDFDGDRWLDLIVREEVTAGRTLCETHSGCGDVNTWTCASGVCRKKCQNNSDCTAFPFEECVDTRSAVVSGDTRCMPPSRVFVAESSCEGIDEDAIELTELFVLQPGEQLGPVVDVDGNGHLDFVGLHPFQQSKTGFVWLNDGQGGFSQLAPAFDYSALYGPGALGHWQWSLTPTSKDLDGDGYVDLLGQSQTSPGAQPTRFWVAPSHGDGTFGAMISLGPTIPYPSNMTTVNDFDGDGDQDIVGGLDEDEKPGTLWMLLNNNFGGTIGAWLDDYAVADVTPSYTSGQNRPGLGTGTSYDFDGDRRPDLLAAWIPEECGDDIYGCTAVQNPANTCFGGDCRRLALMRNRGDSPCQVGSSCVAGACVAGCVASCDGRQCGSDGCGGTCGSCDGGLPCSESGQCVVDCVPDCDGRQCGDNGCGGVCGECAEGLACAYGSCSDDCVPNCSGKECGDDGCGGSCAVFGAPEEITFDSNPGTTLAAPTNVPPTRPVVAIDPPNPGAAFDLSCEILGPSYDLDPVHYRFTWFKDGVFQKALGNTGAVASELTEAGQTWRCRVRASDGIELSPWGDSQVVISE